MLGNPKQNQKSRFELKFAGLLLAAVFLFGSSVQAEPISTTLKELNEIYQGELALPLIAADQAYQETPSREIPRGAFLAGSRVNGPLHMRLVIVRDVKNKVYHVAIRGTDLQNMKSPSFESGASSLFGLREFLNNSRNILQDLGVFESGLQEEKLPLLMKLNQIIETYKKQGRDDPDNISKARNVCEGLARVHSVLPAVSAACGLMAGKAVGAVVASNLGIDCSIGEEIGAGLGAYLGMKALAVLQRKIQAMLNDELVQAFLFVVEEYSKIRKEALEQGWRIELSGHSLGGFFAASLGVLTGDKVFTFNAPGGETHFLSGSAVEIEDALRKNLPELSSRATGISLEEKIRRNCSESDESPIVNVRNPEDIISGFGSPCGKVYSLSSEASTEHPHPLHRMNSYYELSHALAPMRERLETEIPSVINKENPETSANTLRLIQRFARKLKHI